MAFHLRSTFPMRLEQLDIRFPELEVTPKIDAHEASVSDNAHVNQETANQNTIEKGDKIPYDHRISAHKTRVYNLPAVKKEHPWHETVQKIVLIAVPFIIGYIFTYMNGTASSVSKETASFCSDCSNFLATKSPPSAENWFVPYFNLSDPISSRTCSQKIRLPFCLDRESRLRQGILCQDFECVVEEHEAFYDLNKCKELC